MASGLARRRCLLRFLLLLLADADLEVCLLGFPVRLVVVPGHRIRQILVYVGIFRQHCHDRESLIARWAVRPEPFHIWDCHTFSDYHGGSGRGPALHASTFCPPCASYYKNTAAVFCFLERERPSRL